MNQKPQFTSVPQSNGIGRATKTPACAVPGWDVQCRWRPRVPGWIRSGSGLNWPVREAGPAGSISCAAEPRPLCATTGQESSRAATESTEQ